MPADNLAHSLAAGFREKLEALTFWVNGLEYHVASVGRLKRFDRRNTEFAGTVHLRLAENGKRYRVTIRVYEDREQHEQE